MSRCATYLASNESDSLRGVVVWISLAAAVCVIGGFLGTAYYSRGLIQEEMLNSARRNFLNIVLMRRWNADHGGVYVLKRPGVESNPYLDNPDILATDGKAYTMKSSALMTREISELLQKSEGFFFHITSLLPLNPNNAPDQSERSALLSFEKGVPEAVWEQQIGGASHYRYMAPLRVEEGCLTCHAKQGYRVGDVRGGISISFQMSEVQKKLQRNSVVMLGLATLTISGLMIFVGLFARGLIHKLEDTRFKLSWLATTDQLTGLANRTTLLWRLEEECRRQQRSGQALSILMIDVDHFKSVNDSYGHAAGDAALKEIAQHIRSNVRKYDIAARFGEEEFLVVLPDSDAVKTHQTAERIRKVIEEQVRVGPADGQRVLTVSMGAAILRASEDKETLMQRADAALYRAKEGGRNCVVVDAE